MKQAHLFEALNAMSKITEIELPVREAFSLFCLKKMLIDRCNELAGFEQALLEKYGGRLNNTGGIVFPASDDTKEAKLEAATQAERFWHERQELMESDVGDLPAPIRIPSDRFGDYRISADTLAALDGFVEIVGEGE